MAVGVQAKENCFFGTVMREFIQPLPMLRRTSHLWVDYVPMKNPYDKKLKSIPKDISCAEVIKVNLQDQPICQICRPAGKKKWIVRVVTECRYYRTHEKQLRSTKCELKWKWLTLEDGWCESRTLATRWVRFNFRHILDTYTPNSIKEFLGIL